MPDSQWVSCSCRRTGNSTSVKRRCSLKAVFYPQDDFFRLVLVSPYTRRVFAEDRGNELGFPLISVPRWSRAALGLQAAIKDRFAIDVVIVDILEDSPEREKIAMCVTFDQGSEGKLSCMNRWVSLADVATDELLCTEYKYIERLVCLGMTGRGPLARIGWFDDVAEWVGEKTNLEPSHLRASFEQYNMTPVSALIHFHASSRNGYWFKADKESLRGEFRITAALSALFPEHLPRIVALRGEWGAWLTEDAGEPLDQKTPISCRRAEEIVRSLAELQMKSIQHVDALLGSGCVDQRLSKISDGVCSLSPYLREAIDAGGLIDPSAVSEKRLREIIGRIDDACSALDSVGVPDVLIHNHLNLGNILLGKRGCVFIDWANSGIGNPLVGFGQLCPQLAAQRTTGLRRPQLAKSYMKRWASIVDPHRLIQAFDFVPLVALASHLYARKDWVLTDRRHRVEAQRSLISIIEDMDRAARELEMRQAKSLSKRPLRQLRECERQGAA